MNPPPNPNDLRLQCHTLLWGHRPRTAAEDFQDMAAWCAGNDIVHDTYGEGEFVQAFERKVADLLGFEAAHFIMSGTLTQVTALRIASHARSCPIVAMHPTAHILRHERSNYQLLDHFKVLPVGDPFRTWALPELLAWPDRIGAVLYELPMREIGGQLPSWEDLDAIKTHCHSANIHLHLDGARLWEAAAGYGRAYAEIAAGFDSAYVSFYKGIGGLGGAMLLGSRKFIDQAAIWAKRQGGNLYRRSPYVVAAAMQFDARIAAMPAYFQRTRQFYELLQDFPLLRPNPAAPQANMLHLYLPVGVERAHAIRDDIARSHGVWLFGKATPAALPDTSYLEGYVGDNLTDMTDARVREILGLWSANLAGKATR